MVAAPFGLYLHVPFCRSRCHYCAFYFRPGHRSIPGEYVDRLARELETAAGDPRFAGRMVSSVYFGGGTPGLMEPVQLERLLAAVSERFEVEAGAEISLEANPEGLDGSRLTGFREAGANRLTLGWQAVRAELLRDLTRTHSADDGYRALEAAREAGFENVGVDLMFGLPGQTPAEWREDLAAVAAAGVDHVSAYELTFEEGTRLTRRHGEGRYDVPGEDDRTEMFLDAGDGLGAQGIPRYEISNFARPGFECAHNLAAWRGGDLLGVGPSAASHVRETRWRRPADLERWSAAVDAGASPEEGIETLDASTWAAEDLYLGLRTMEGIDADRRLATVPEDSRRRLGSVLERNVEAGLLEAEGGRVRLTRSGLLLADGVFEELLGG